VSDISKFLKFQEAFFKKLLGGVQGQSPCRPVSSERRRHPKGSGNAPSVFCFFARNGVSGHSKFLKIQETFFKKFLGGVWGRAPRQ
jgi:hypothetical protein